MRTELHRVDSEAQRALGRSQETQIMRPTNLGVGRNLDCLIHQCLCQATIQHHASRNKELTALQVPALNSWMFHLRSNRNSPLLRSHPSIPALHFCEYFLHQSYVAEMWRPLSSSSPSITLFSLVWEQTRNQVSAVTFLGQVRQIPHL